jgi:hypothetical protein
MNLKPFKSKRRANQADFWSLSVKLDVDPTLLRPSGDAKHNVFLANEDTMTYEFTVHGQCGPMLRYGSKDEWGPHRETLKPKEDFTMQGKIGLPATCDKGQLPAGERIAVKVDARPLNPRVLAQEDFLYCNLELNE